MKVNALIKNCSYWVAMGLLTELDMNESFIRRKGWSNETMHVTTIKLKYGTGFIKQFILEFIDGKGSEIKYEWRPRMDEMEARDWEVITTDPSILNHVDNAAKEDIKRAQEETAYVTFPYEYKERVFSLTIDMEGKSMKGLLNDMYKCILAENK